MMATPKRPPPDTPESGSTLAEPLRLMAEQKLELALLRRDISRLDAKFELERRRREEAEARALALTEAVAQVKEDLKVLTQVLLQMDKAYRE